ncbi:hypothetical protein Cgig2_031866 [Carnegiea gigantea]|uniref:Reverse transcriptase zinc-binding domain-containing protein n=1 Tax=Carnegiea gigantea TaxID=171969 RepID=A0A9Q1KT40_9CARY|nr:hypothetical protein Cgig2_031866 [Carnegiea gigantea]
MEWSILFSHAEVIHLDEHISDHLPILLKFRKDTGRKIGRKKHFKFENMWIHDEGFRQTVKDAWESFNSQDPWANLEGKLSSYSGALLKWNEEVFGNVIFNIKALERQLRGQENIQEVRNKADLLKHGNSNSRWFHTRANMRRVINLISSLKRGQTSSSDYKKDWKIIRKLDVPPRIKLFGWKVAVNALAMRVNLSCRISSIGMRCEICGAIKESDIHDLFLCLLAAEVWVGSGFEEMLWDGNVISPIDALMKASQRLMLDRLGEHVAVMWECWNSRNRFIFGKKEGNRAGLATRAMAFVHNFRRIREDDTPAPTTSATTCWMPPSLGLFKLNFDARKVGQNGRGWGFVVRDSMGELVLAGVTQDEGFLSPEVEESRACMFDLKTTAAHGFKRLVVESNSLAFTSYELFCPFMSLLTIKVISIVNEAGRRKIDKVLHVRIN